MIIPKMPPSIIEVAQALELKLEPSAGELRCRCPNPEHIDENPSCYINPDKGVWYCQGCGAGGDAISLYVVAKSCSRQTAEDALDYLGGAHQAPLPFKMLNDDGPIDAAYTFCSIMKELGQRGDAVPPHLLILLQEENPVQNLRRFLENGNNDS